MPNPNQASVFPSIDSPSQEVLWIELSSELVNKALAGLKLPPPIVEALVERLRLSSHSGWSFVLAIESVLSSERLYGELGLMEEDTRVLYAVYGEVIIKAISEAVNEPNFTHGVKEQLKDTDAYMRRGGRNTASFPRRVWGANFHSESYSDLLAERHGLADWIASQYANYNSALRGAES